MGSIISGLLSIATRLFSSSAFMNTISFALKRWFIGSAVATYSGLLVAESYGILPKGIADILKGVPAQLQLTIAGLGVVLYLITHLSIFKPKIEKEKQKLELQKLETEYKKAKLEALKTDIEIKQQEKLISVEKED